MIAGTVTSRASASGPAAPQEVWDRYVHPSRWPSWSPQIRGVRLDDGTDRLRAGSSGTVHGPLGLRVRFVVQEVDDEARRWSWGVALAGPVPVALDLQHGVDPAAGGGTRTWVDVSGPSVVVAAYLPATWWALRRLVRP